MNLANFMDQVAILTSKVTATVASFKMVSDTDRES